MARTEHQEQCSFFKWLKIQYPHVDVTTFAVPNGGKRSKAGAQQLKNEGVKKGVCDIFSAFPVDGFHGRFIEMKVIDGTVSKEQTEWITNLRGNGYACCVCYGFDQAKECMQRYLKGEV